MFVAEDLRTRVQVPFFQRESIPEQTVLVHIAPFFPLVAILRVSFSSGMSAINAVEPFHYSLGNALELAELPAVGEFSEELGVPGRSTLRSFSCTLLSIVFTLCSTGKFREECCLETQHFALVKDNILVWNCEMPLFVTDDSSCDKLSFSKSAFPDLFLSNTTSRDTTTFCLEMSQSS